MESNKNGKGLKKRLFSTSIRQTSALNYSAFDKGVGLSLKLSINIKVEYFSVFENLVFEITSRILRILMERIKIEIAYNPSY